MPSLETQKRYLEEEVSRLSSALEQKRKELYTVRHQISQKNAEKRKKRLSRKACILDSLKKKVSLFKVGMFVKMNGTRDRGYRKIEAVQTIPSTDGKEYICGLNLLQLQPPRHVSEDKINPENIPAGGQRTYQNFNKLSKLWIEERWVPMEEILENLKEKE